MTLTLHMMRYYAPCQEDVEDVHEAVALAFFAVEQNEASPVALRDADGNDLIEGYDLSGLYEDPEYSRDMSLDDVLALLKRQAREAAQRSKDEKIRRAAEEAATIEKMHALGGKLIQYTHAYSPEALRERVLYKMEVVGLLWSSEPSEGPPTFTAESKTDRVVGGHIHQDVHMVNSYMFGASRPAPGRKHFLLETESGDHVDINHAKVVTP